MKNFLPGHTSDEGTKYDGRVYADGGVYHFMAGNRIHGHKGRAVAVHSRREKDSSPAELPSQKQ